ncbi:long-chain fatty acid--CoA ligase, partial [Gordonia paraffinivorans]|nr:long-chain fatty acid--CoA ligase [Gordonia paraffinivorans]
ALRKQGSIGKVVPAVTARIVDPLMNDVKPGEVGEIVYRGPNLMKGYWNKPEETAEAFRGGWFHSGDLVRQDEEGFLYVVDRAKDMIISGGENIYCAEVENVLYGHPKIAEAAIIGRAHEKWGEVPVDDVEKALLVLPDQVAGVEPAAAERLCGLLGLVPVALHQVGATIDDLPHLAGFDVVHQRVDDPRGHRRHDLADRSLL